MTLDLPLTESIAVRELRPSLNGNVALYLSPIYGLVPSKYSRDDDWFDSGDVINNRDTGMTSAVGSQTNTNSEDGSSPAAETVRLVNYYLIIKV